MRWVAALASTLAACATGTATVAVPTVAVPDDAARSGWATSRLDEGLATVVATLTSRGAAGLRALRLRPEELASVFTDEGRQRVEGSLQGLTPTPRERRWQLLAARRGQSVVGWCARGVHVAEAGGAEGFRARTLYVDRVLVVGAEPGGRWGMWLEGLVLTGAGWRMLPWVTSESAVEAPRRDHVDAALWDCDLARRGD